MKELNLAWRVFPNDRLDRLAQIPGVKTVVTALNDWSTEQVWPRDKLERIRDAIATAGLDWGVVESVPVDDRILVGDDDADRLIDIWCETLMNLADVGVQVVTYNAMLVFDWMRTNLKMRLPDGSFTLAYDHEELARLHPDDVARLPGWAKYSTPDELRSAIARYRGTDRRQLWDSLSRFLERVVPVAEEKNLKLAIHPDDPPWDLDRFELPRIITNEQALADVIECHKAPANGLCFCTGSLRTLPENNLPSMIRRFGRDMGRIHFVHCRNVKNTGEKKFHETAHPDGDISMEAVVAALCDAGYDGPVRPDHGRDVWGEDTDRPGYGWFDRAWGAVYLLGLWRGILSERQHRQSAPSVPMDLHHLGQTTSP